ncbi:hypothetical protein [Streptomyces caeni]|uniref:hypothetical protein n=1 Tax=Streptomyces caeni TaxID=2307231 RepID=UPI0036D2189E
MRSSRSRAFVREIQARPVRHPGAEHHHHQRRTGEHTVLKIFGDAFVQVFKSPFEFLSGAGGLTGRRGQVYESETSVLGSEGLPKSSIGDGRSH